MSFRSENYSKLAKLSSNHFLSANNKLIDYGENTQRNLKLCQKDSLLKYLHERIDWIKFVNENNYKKFIWKLPKATPFKGNLCKILKKNSLHNS